MEARMSPAIAVLLADIAEETLADELRKRGWICTRISRYDWETPSAFSKRHGFHPTWLSKRLSRGAYVPDFDADKCKDAKRIIKLRSNPELEIFCDKIRLQYNLTKVRPYEQTA